METLFTTLLNHQRFDHFHWFLLLFCITSSPWITKDWIIFIDFCCGFASLVFEVNHVLMPIGMETLITTPLNHQRFDHFHWFLLWFCITSLWNKSCFHANWVWKLYLLPSWITKDLIIFIGFCCCFASLVESPKIWWFLLWFCITSLWSKSCFNAIWYGNFIYYPPESPKIWSFSLIFAVVLHH